MVTTRLKVAFLLALASLAGCVRRQPPREFQPIILDTADAAGKVDYSGLAAVLKDSVGPGGKILPKELKANAKMLEGQLMLMTLAGPQTRADLFEGEHSELNYWYNARAAWSLRLMLTFSAERLKADGEETGPDDRWRIENDGVSIEEFRNRPFPIDGKSMTLALMDSLIIEKFGFKAVVGAPGVSPVRGAIPAKPFNASSTGELIDKRFNDFIDDADRFVIDIPSKRILAPPILWRFERRMIEAHEWKHGITGVNLTTALLPHVRLSPHRRLQDAVGYKCVQADEPKVPLIVKRAED
ncbi:MAG: hypothetical protein QGG42_03110 [Phycisphaerae bacterium]|jgi:hypothetical protein|nr:hypothetical protein [Phycisphaerae bacterium]